MRESISGLGGAALSVLMLMGCTAEAAGVASVQALPDARTATFDGSPLEFQAEGRSCMEDLGVVTEDDPYGAPLVFTTTPGPNIAPEAVDAIVQACWASLGPQPLGGDLPMDELQRRYEARLAQWACLRDRGLVVGSAPTFDEAVTDYEARGRVYFWEPTEAASLEIDGVPASPSDECPRDPNIW